jgi:acetoin:2,6-dichlorophenolindophenol oxidoreductase subunit beta
MSGGQTHVPLTIRTMTGAGFGTGGQHADYLEAWFAHTAGIKVVAPSNPADAYGLMLSCIFDDDPCLFIENMPTYWSPGPAPTPGERIPLGKANVLRAGKDVTVVSYSRTVADCAAVADKLAKEGVGVELIDLRTVAPYDAETVLTSVARTRRAVIVHEAVKPFGVGAEIAARLNEDLFGQLKAKVERVGAYFSPVPFAKVLETEYVPTQSRIEAAIRNTLR